MTEDKDWMEPDEDAPELEAVDDIDLHNKPALGEDRVDTIKQIADAKKKSKQIAGLVKSTESGSTWSEDEPEDVKIPHSSIHTFENTLECKCSCHPSKRDCVDCYDHPVHLEKKRNMSQPESVDGYNEEKIMELIEEDKAKTDKKHWWQRK